jgi:hypothetical protein
VNIIAALLFLMPRSVLSYVGYSFMLPLILNYQIKRMVQLYLILFSCLLAFIISGFDANVAITNFIVEMIFLVPFIYILVGGGVRLEFDHISLLNKLIIAGTFILSLINMIVHGFPFVLPYVHILPDVYGAMYGLGGAKIVTVVAFFTFYIEMLNKKYSHWILIALFNLIFPSYMIGIFCAFLAMFVMFFKGSKRNYTLLFCAIVPVVFYAFHRVEGMNFSFFNEFGLHPKIYALVNVLIMLYNEGVSLLFGVGLGQYSSTPAIWASAYLNEYSSHNIKSLPGMFSSDFHNEYLVPLLAFFDGNQWAMSSSLNKPYSSLSTIVAEVGLIGFFGFIYLLCRRVIKCFSRNEIALIIYIVILFLMDLWHDNPWFIFMLAISIRAKELAVEVLYAK